MMHIALIAAIAGCSSVSELCVDEDLRARLEALSSELSEKVHAGEVIHNELRQSLFSTIRETRFAERREEYSEVLWRITETVADLKNPHIALWALDALWEIERPIERLESLVEGLEERPDLAGQAVAILGREPSLEHRMDFAGLAERARAVKRYGPFSAPLVDAKFCQRLARQFEEIHLVREQAAFLLRHSVGPEWWSLTRWPGGGLESPEWVMQAPPPAGTWYARNRLRVLSDEYALDVAQCMVDFEFWDYFDDEPPGPGLGAPQMREWLATNVLAPDCARRWRELQGDDGDGEGDGER